MHRRFLSFMSAVLIVLGLANTADKEKPIPIASRIEMMNNETAALVNAGGNDDDDKIFCSAVWINGNTMLTAKHCVIAANETLEALDEAGIDVANQLVGTEILYITYEDFLRERKTPRVSHVLGIDHSDMALLRVTEVPFHRVPRIGMDVPFTSERVDIMGHTMGLGWTYSEGYISTRTRMLVDLSPLPTRFVQVSSDLNQGNSGGGLYDERGDLIGIASFLSQHAQTLSFSLHPYEIRRFLDEAHIKYRR